MWLCLGGRVGRKTFLNPTSVHDKGRPVAGAVQSCLLLKSMCLNRAGATRNADRGWAGLGLFGPLFKVACSLSAAARYSRRPPATIVDDHRHKERKLRNSWFGGEPSIFLTLNYGLLGLFRWSKMNVSKWEQRSSRMPLIEVRDSAVCSLRSLQVRRLMAVMQAGWFIRL